MTAAVATPTVRTAVRRWRFWAGIGVVVIVAAVVAFLVTGSRVGGVPLSPANPAPAGARALAEVLRAQGVDVVEPADLDVAVASAPGSTLLLHDANGFLDAAALDRLAAADPARIVLLDPAAAVLDALAPGVLLAGTSTERVSADCADEIVRRAGGIAGDATRYVVPPGAEGCWRDADGTARLVLLDDGRVAVVGTTGAFSNEQIVLAGNAAFALGILGEHDRLVWFQPTVADATGAPPTIGELSPAWVVPLALLGVAVVLAAALWRGRRFGPLVVEPLPAVVRADETMRGRARLMAAGRTRLRAADDLRLGALDRIAGLLGLPAAADVDRIVDAAAAVTGRAPTSLRGLLRDRVPGTDRELVELAEGLAALEAAVRAAVGHGRMTS